MNCLAFLFFRMLLPSLEYSLVSISSLHWLHSSFIRSFVSLFSLRRRCQILLSTGATGWLWSAIGCANFARSSTFTTTAVDIWYHTGKKREFHMLEENGENWLVWGKSSFEKRKDSDNIDSSQSLWCLFFSWEEGLPSLFLCSPILIFFHSFSRQTRGLPLERRLLSFVRRYALLFALSPPIAPNVHVCGSRSGRGKQKSDGATDGRTKNEQSRLLWTKSGN